MREAPRKPEQYALHARSPDVEPEASGSELGPEKWFREQLQASHHAASPL